MDAKLAKRFGVRYDFPRLDTNLTDTDRRIRAMRAAASFPRLEKAYNHNRAKFGFAADLGHKPKPAQVQAIEPEKATRSKNVTVRRKSKMASEYVMRDNLGRVIGKAHVTTKPKRDLAPKESMRQRFERIKAMPI